MTSPQKNIIITGCSSGFGKALAEGFAQKNWQVLATTRHPEQLESKAHLTVLHADVASDTGRHKVKEYIQTQWHGRVDCLVNNAGFGLAGPVEMLSETQIRQQMEVNFFTPLLLTQMLLPNLRQHNGRVINISSLFGYSAMPLQSAYIASKFAIEGLSESLYYELANHGIQLAIIEPGGFKTGFAAHMQWPQHPSPEHCCYDKQLQGFQQFFQKLSTKKKGKQVNQLVNTVLALTQKRRMPLRTRIGSDAHFLYYLRRFLPQRLADKILLYLNNRLLRP